MSARDEHLRGRWFVAAEAKRLGAKPLAAIVLGTPLVLYRSGNGIVAAEDRCPHRNVPLSAGAVESGRLRCPYHGWCFDGSGRCVEAPGLADAEPPPVGLRCWNAVEADGWIWVAPLGAEERTIYRPPSAVRGDAAKYRDFRMTSDVAAALPDALENLLDGTHTPFVHRGLVRSAAKQRFTAVIRRCDDAIEAEYRGERGQAGLISRLFEPEREVSFGRFVPPCTAELEYRSRTRIELFVAAHFTPTTAGRLRVFVACYVPGGPLAAVLKHTLVRPLFRHVLKQDRAILELQSRNLERFGGPAYVNWTADLMRPWIEAWLRDGRFPEQTDEPREISFLL